MTRKTEKLIHGKGYKVKFREQSKIKLPFRSVDAAVGIKGRLIKGRRYILKYRQNVGFLFREEEEISLNSGQSSFEKSTVIETF